MGRVLETEYRYFVDGGVPNSRTGHDTHYGSWKCIEVQKIEGTVVPKLIHHPQQWLSHGLAIKTNNMAEFASLIELLLYVNDTHQSPQDKVIIFMDSQVVLHSIWGIKRIKDSKLVPLHEQTLRLVAASQCNLSFQWISGKQMKSPDLLGH